MRTPPRQYRKPLWKKVPLLGDGDNRYTALDTPRQKMFSLRNETIRDLIYSHISHAYNSITSVRPAQADSPINSQARTARQPSSPVTGAGPPSRMAV